MIQANDLRRWTHDLGREWSKSPPDGPRVLFTVAGMQRFEFKLACVLAKGLALHGARPVFIADRRSWTVFRPYARPLGIDEAVLLDDGEAPSGLGAAEDLVRHALANANDLRDLLEVEFAGAWIGRNALSTTVRALRLGSFRKPSAEVWERVRSEMLRASVVALATHRILDAGLPRAVLFHERGYLPFSSIYDVSISRGVDVAQFMLSHREDALFLKRLDSKSRFDHCTKVSTATWERAKGIPWTREESADVPARILRSYEDSSWFRRKGLTRERRMMSPDQIRTDLRLRPGRKLAVIFPHILWDATFFYGRTLFNDYEEWFVRTLEAAASNDALDWIVKIHPDHVWKSKEEGYEGAPAEMEVVSRVLRERPAHIRVLPPTTEILTAALYPFIDYGVTVRGTVGLELPCFGVPVLTAGTGRYEGLGFTIDSKTPEEYVQRLSQIQDYPRLTPVETDLARRHFRAVFHARPWVFEAFELRFRSFSEAHRPFVANVWLRAKRPEDLACSPDVGRFARWVLEDGSEDYVEEGFEGAGIRGKPA